MTVGILLVGGFGTRLMPLTKNAPKPMLTVAGLPVTEHQLALAKRAGITTVVLATSYLSEVFIPYFGDGSKWGMKLLYAVEKEPLGTGGAIRNAAKLLATDESVVVFNGDVLSSHNLALQIQEHEANNANATLHLTAVEDARAYGCVPTDSDGRITAFLEKMENPVTNTINAGCYVFKPSVIQSIEPNRVVSVEREVFPNLVASHGKIFGFIDDSYWLDIGTPQALLKGSRDLVTGSADASALTADLIESAGKDFLIMKGAQVDPSAHIDEGSCISSGAIIGASAHISGSIIESGAQVGAGATIINSFIASGAVVANSVKISASFVTNTEIIEIPA
jgi:mannose-1-phosphate guanylyltransferase|uniref:sugar phosphate nucleotidyltransferase n=1 Tax=Candidatus Planktophila sp. TaxID=2175601 RepID=UPI00404A1448